MVELIFGAAFVLIALCATALYITYSYSVWPFKPLSIEVPVNRAPENVVPPKTIEERLAELGGDTTATTSDPKQIQARRAEISAQAPQQNNSASKAAIQERLDELGN